MMLWRGERAAFTPPYRYSVQNQSGQNHQTTANLTTPAPGSAERIARVGVARGEVAGAGSMRRNSPAISAGG